MIRKRRWHEWLARIFGERIVGHNDDDEIVICYRLGRWLYIRR